MLKMPEEQRKKDESSFLPSLKDICSNPACNHSFGEDK